MKDVVGRVLWQNCFRDQDMNCSGSRKRLLTFSLRSWTTLPHYLMSLLFKGFEASVFLSKLDFFQVWFALPTDAADALLTGNLEPRLSTEAAIFTKAFEILVLVGVCKQALDHWTKCIKMIYIRYIGLYMKRLLEWVIHVVLRFVPFMGEVGPLSSQTIYCLIAPENVPTSGMFSVETVFGRSKNRRPSLVKSSSNSS